MCVGVVVCLFCLWVRGFEERGKSGEVEEAWEEFLEGVRCEGDE